MAGCRARLRLTKGGLQGFHVPLGGRDIVLAVLVHVAAVVERLRDDPPLIANVLDGLDGFLEEGAALAQQNDGAVSLVTKPSASGWDSFMWK